MPARASSCSIGFRPAFEWAVAPEASFVEGDIADEALVGRLIAEHDIDAVIHFAGSIVVPESVADPLGYYLNNTVKSRALIETAVTRRGAALHLLVDRGGLWRCRHRAGASRRAPTLPLSPYGRSKLMTEMDAGGRGDGA